MAAALPQQAHIFSTTAEMLHVECESLTGLTPDSKHSIRRYEQIS